MEEEASTIGMGLDMVIRRGETVEVMLGRHGWDNGQVACLVFRELI